MREIEFRIWDKKNAKFISKWERVFINAWECCVYTKSELEKKDFSYNNDLSEIEVNQFTGLKDSKGVEIYEGDIIEFALSLFESVKGSVEFDYGAFYLKPTDKKYNNVLLANMNFDLVEVIGNIYENSELLGEKNE